jgi:hypothetical protein
MSNHYISFSDASGGLNLGATERSLQTNEALDLMNVEITKDGGILKCNGYVQSNLESIPDGARITGMYHYVQSNGMEKTIVTAGSGLYVLESNGQFTNYYQELAEESSCFFATFNDLCIITNGINPPLKFDGTTVTPLANWGDIETSGYPALVEVWKNRIWFSANPIKPYRVYWSEPGNPEGWDTTHGAGAVDVNLNDGQRVTGIKSYFDALTIYKERSIHQLIGDSPPGSNGPNEFRIRPVSTDIGCVSPGTIVNVENRQYFLAEDRLASLETTYAFGDIQTTNESRKIQPLLDRVNRGAYQETFILHYPSKSQIWLFYPDTISSQNNRVAIYDYTLNAWIQRNGIHASKGLFVNGIPYTGSYDGNVHRQDFGGHYNGAPISAVYKTPWYSFGNYQVLKRIRSIDLTVMQYGNWNLNLETLFDYETSGQTFQINQAQSEHAPLWGVAHWNQANWTALNLKQVRQVSEIGMGKALQFAFSNNEANQPFHILGWDVTYQLRGLRG